MNIPLKGKYDTLINRKKKIYTETTEDSRGVRRFNSRLQRTILLR